MSGGREGDNFVGSNVGRAGNGLALGVYPILYIV